MTQKKFFIGVDDDTGGATFASNNMLSRRDDLATNLLIPFPEKIKVSQKNFKKLINDLYTQDEVTSDCHQMYGLDTKQMLILLFEYELNNNLIDFVDIVEPRHAYRIKKELEDKNFYWDTTTPYLIISPEGKAAYSRSNEYKYSRSEFEQLPKEIQALFTEVTDGQ
ncbi:hypothetical protein [Oenococcus sicerae]|uniref:hypothetical protein n=1 Tax=Oenococcus sicerae TaxID=2203724 RepID=UPI0039EB9B87